MQALRLVHGIQHPDRLQFNQQPVLDHQIGRILADDHAVIMHSDITLLRHDKTEFAQLMRQGILINLLQKAAPKRMLDDERPTNDRVAQAVNINICVHPWFHRLPALPHPE